MSTKKNLTVIAAAILMSLAFYALLSYYFSNPVEAPTVENGFIGPTGPPTVSGPTGPPPGR